MKTALKLGVILLVMGLLIPAVATTVTARPTYNLKGNWALFDYEVGGKFFGYKVNDKVFGIVKYEGQRGYLLVTIEDGGTFHGHLRYLGMNHPITGQYIFKSGRFGVTFLCHGFVGWIVGVKV